MFHQSTAVYIASTAIAICALLIYGAWCELIEYLMERDQPEEPVITKEHQKLFTNK